MPYIRDSQGMNPIANSWDPPICVCMLLALSCPALCNPMDCSLPDSSVHRILQARILEWVAIPFSRRSSWPRGRTWASHIAGRFFTIWATGDPPPPDPLHWTVLVFQTELSCNSKNTFIQEYWQAIFKQEHVLKDLRHQSTLPKSSWGLDIPSSKLLYSRLPSIICADTIISTTIKKEKGIKLACHLFTCFWRTCHLSLGMRSASLSLSGCGIMRSLSELWMQKCIYGTKGDLCIF